MKHKKELGTDEMAVEVNTLEDRIKALEKSLDEIKAVRRSTEAGISIEKITPGKINSPDGRRVRTN